MAATIIQPQPFLSVLHDDRNHTGIQTTLSPPPLAQSVFHKTAISPINHQAFEEKSTLGQAAVQ